MAAFCRTYCKVKTYKEDFFDADLLVAFSKIGKCLKARNLCKETDKSQELLKALIETWKIVLTYELLIPFKDETIEDFFNQYDINIIDEEDGPYPPAPSMGELLCSFYTFEHLVNLTTALNYTIQNIYENMQKNYKKSKQMTFVKKTRKK